MGFSSWITKSGVQTAYTGCGRGIISFGPVGTGGMVKSNWKMLTLKTTQLYLRSICCRSMIW